MAKKGIAGSTAVIGVGMSDLSLQPALSNEGLAVQAFRRAMEGLALDKSEIDGLVVTSGGLDYDKTAETLGLYTSFSHQTWSHGRFSNPGLHTASMAIYTGMAKIVVCVSVFPFAKRKKASGNIGGHGDMEANRPGGGPHGESPVYGLAAPMGGAAMAYQRYLSRYGYTGEESADLVITQRANALKNPQAIMTKAVDRDDYLSSPFVIWPLRKLDCALPSDGCAVVIVTSAERARDLTDRPAYINGMRGIHSSRNEHSFGAPWLGIFQQDHQEPRIADEAFHMAGIDRKDIAAVQIYDAFLPQTIATFERFGFCAPGEALRYMRSERISIGGECPVNTAGGHLSEAHCGGWGHIVEAVRQVRGECGERQVANANHTIYAHSAGDCTIFSKEVA